ncbi:ROK family transcriptional regulator [Frondihabitans australicus]|uniref:Putative NBD/HSP70 family sugar kinase n=1 Tax=Frondihabitans australicus TaxID=386892 RepID=A0A495IHG4_9MICO|nr:ROK family transcriptional regulator [Frondihabitans australicus]RKR75442.1 putative NBD/HSP70 family sugar kinase [Frondihabitans australicus]
MRTGTNLPAIGGYNQAVVLDAVRRSPEGLSRTEIAENTGLSAQTVGNVTRRLLDERLVDETGTVSVGRGKPRTILQLRGQGGFAVGVHIDPAVITYVVLDLRGSVIAHSRTRTPSAQEPAAVIRLMAHAIRSLVDDSGVDPGLVIGVGIASPGPIDAEAGTVLDPPMLDGWQSVPLRAALSEATGLPVLLEKDVTAAAVAELWFARGPSRSDFAFVYYGTGFGIGLVVGREVIRGATSNAGDAGHITVDPDGPECVCGRRGCVGDLITPRSLVREAAAAGVVSPVPGASAHPPDMTAVGNALHELAASAGAEDEAAVRILRSAAHRLARALVVIANLLDVDEFVFGGPFWDDIGDALLAALPWAVESSPARVSRRSLSFETSRIGEDVAAVGAACLVLDHAFSPRPSAMLISV